jgi:hypothetical protein
MKWLYVYLPGSPHQSALERRLVERITRETAHQVEFWDWGVDFGVDFNPSPDWAEQHREFLRPFHELLLSRAADFDAILIAQTGAVPPDVMASLPGLVVYNTADDPDSSPTCSFPYLQAAHIIAHAGTRYDDHNTMAEEFRQRGARRTLFFPLGFHEEEFPPIDEIEENLARRQIPIVYVGHLKRGKLETLMRAFPDMRVHSHSLKWKHHLYLLATTGRIVRAWTESLASLYHNCQVGINIHYTHGPSNVRSYQLCASGVAQVMDCPLGVPQLYKPSTEVLTFSTLEEAAGQIRGLLADQDLRIHVARAGYQAAHARFTRFRTFTNLLDQAARSDEWTGADDRS